MKKEAAYVAVDKNTSGSRPRELFEDAVEEAEAALEVRNAVQAVIGSISPTACVDETRWRKPRSPWRRAGLFSS